MDFLRVKILFSLWLKCAERQPQVGHFRLISIKSANYGTFTILLLYEWFNVKF